jgi:tripartite-type tricarboxylate transporter receptor subunit TctC
MIQWAISNMASRYEGSRIFNFWASTFGALLAAVAIVGDANAQAYPSRPVKIIVPFAAGSATDVTARLIADKLAENMGGSFVVENRTGAGGNLAADVVAKADPDGYTLAYSSSGPLAINKTLFSKLPYDPEADFEPITLTAILPNLLVVNPKIIPAKNVQEFIAYVKSKPAGDVVYSSIGNGSSQHLAAIQFELATGVKMKHVPYRGAPQAVADLLKGDVPVAFQNIPSVLGLLQTGQIKALAITTKTRNKILPDLPTMQEEGVKDFESYAWFGILAPKGTPQPIVERLHKELVKALTDPNLSKRMIEIGAEPTPISREEFKKLIADEVLKWRQILTAGNVPKVDQ